jgi:hypothetical protein
MKPLSKQFLLVMGGGVLGALLVQLVITLVQSPRNSTGALMTEATDSLNRHLPMMIDSETQLTATMVFSRMLQYNYRLVRLDAAQVDTVALAAAFKRRLQAGACTGPELRDRFLKKGVTVRFAYADSSSHRLFSVDVQPKDCGF